MTETLRKIREFGQEMTPYWVAKIMLSYFNNDKIDQILDPAVGNGIFYAVFKDLRPTEIIKFVGYDIDDEIINDGYKSNIFDKMCDIRNEDFIKNYPEKSFNYIISNPPYIRHHRISAEAKNIFKEICLRNIGRTIDGRAGIHIYFLIIALNMLSENGKLSIILPSDACEGVFSRDLWNWVSSKYCIEKVITFIHETSPFPKRDNNAMIFFITRKNQKETIDWIKVRNNNDSVYDDILNSNAESDNIEIVKRDVNEALSTGLSRAPNYSKEEFKLCDFASVMRGIATGDNNFFFLKRKTIDLLEIPSEFFVRAIGRTRDVSVDVISETEIRTLDENGRPTMLLSLDRADLSGLPDSIQKYIKHGERIGVNKKALISTRNPWYKMEKRQPPEFLFAYLGRRNVRFIYNKAKVVPLTGFLCVYPFNNQEEYLNKFRKVLNDPITLNNLNMVGKTYGSGAIKVEPKSLLKLPISKNVLKKYGLPAPTKKLLF